MYKILNDKDYTVFNGRLMDNFSITLLVLSR